jgi:hypothetical protein
MFKCRDLQVAYAVLLLVVVAGLARRWTCMVLLQDYLTLAHVLVHQSSEARAPEDRARPDQQGLLLSIMVATRRRMKPRRLECLN